MLGAMKQMQYDAVSSTAYWITQLNVPNFNGNASSINTSSLYIDSGTSKVYMAGYLALGNVYTDPLSRTYSSVISLTPNGDLNFGENYTFANTATNTQYGSTQMFSITGNAVTSNVYPTVGVGIIPTISSTSGSVNQIKAYNGNYNYNDFDTRSYGPSVILSPTTGGNIITVGYLQDGINSGTIISCIKDNGNILYTKQYGGVINGTTPNLLSGQISAQLDTSNNLYMGGYVEYYYSTVPYAHNYLEAQVYKINSNTGVPIYGTRIYNTENGGPSISNSPQIQGVAGDTTGNLYAVWNDTTLNSSQCFLSKWSSGTGTPVWTYKTSINIASTTGTTLTGLRSDASNNLYAFGYSSTASTSYPFIIKYDSSGTILWSKTFSSSDFPVGNGYVGFGTIRDLQVVPGNANGDFIIALQFSASPPYRYSTNLWKLPGNGTGNGTYTITYYNGSSYITGNVTYGDAGFTNSANGYAANVAFANGLGVTVSNNNSFVANATVIDTFTANNYNTWGGPITTKSQTLNI